MIVPEVIMQVFSKLVIKSLLLQVLPTSSDETTIAESIDSMDNMQSNNDTDDMLMTTVTAKDEIDVTENNYA